jgi:hypothetical protein
VSSAQERENRGNLSLCLLVSGLSDLASKSINHLVIGRRLKKWSDLWDLGSELSVLSTSKPYTVGMQQLEAKQFANHRLRSQFPMIPR